MKNLIKNQTFSAEHVENESNASHKRQRNRPRNIFRIPESLESLPQPWITLIPEIKSEAGISQGVKIENPLKILHRGRKNDRQWPTVVWRVLISEIVEKTSFLHSIVDHHNDFGDFYFAGSSVVAKRSDLLSVTFRMLNGDRFVL